MRHTRAINLNAFSEFFKACAIEPMIQLVARCATVEIDKLIHAKKQKERSSLLAKLFFLEIRHKLSLREIIVNEFTSWIIMRSPNPR